MKVLNETVRKSTKSHKKWNPILERQSQQKAIFLNMRRAQDEKKDHFRYALGDVWRKRTLCEIGLDRKRSATESVVVVTRENRK